MKTRHLLLLAALSVGLQSLWAQGPNGSGTYYRNADGKSSAASLKTALHSIINPHHNIGYDGLFTAYQQTDKRPDGKVRDWYSNATNYDFSDHSSYSKEGDCYNREHTVPQSWFGSGVIKSDIVHVVPADGYVNNRRSNFPFGEVNNITWSSKNSYSKLGSCKTNGYTGTVFEPNDEIKGDMARIYFYMVTCYENVCSNWGHNVFSSSNLGFEGWVLDMLLRWSRQDPVDEREVARNNAVYATQENRNPFVDYPGLEEYIWGTKVGQRFSYDQYEGGGGDIIPTIAMPVFSPDEGTYYNSVEVTLTTATEGAEIYYTTDGTNPAADSKHYEGPFTLTETTTVRAVAIKDGQSSYTAYATYRIMDEGGSETPEDGTILFCNNLFGTNYSGSINKSDSQDLTGTQNGVTIVYSLGAGQNRYCSSEQIRLYPGNTLSVMVSQATITELEFIFDAATPRRDLVSGSTTLDNGKWTGEASAVTVRLSDATADKHARLTGVKVKLAESTGVHDITTTRFDGQRVIYNLQGQRVLNPTHGVYIVDGKKVLIP